MGHPYTLRPEFDQHLSDVKETSAHILGQGHQFGFSLR